MNSVLPGAMTLFNQTQTLYDHTTDPQLRSTLAHQLSQIHEAMPVYTMTPAEQHAYIDAVGVVQQATQAVTQAQKDLTQVAAAISLIAQAVAALAQAATV
jgi:hypothetical protein